MSDYRFEFEDFSDEDFFGQAVGMYSRNLDRSGALVPLKTTASQSSIPRKGLTTTSVSDILQGLGIRRSDSFVASSFNQSLSSDLSGLLSSEGGVGSIMGSRSSLLAHDIMTGKRFDDGRLSGETGINSGAVIGTVVADATGAPQEPPPNIVDIPAGSSPKSLGLSNGNIPTSMLVPVGSDSSGEPEHLWAPAAESYFRMKAAAAKEGINLSLADCYRPLAKQEYFWHCFQTKSCNNGNKAAPPGTSNHGWGMSIDFHDINYGDRKYQWLTIHGGAEGWINDVGGEPWHWTYQR